MNQEHVRTRAYFVWQAAVDRGEPVDGHDWRDWFESEAEERRQARDATYRHKPRHEEHGR